MVQSVYNGDRTTEAVCHFITAFWGQNVQNHESHYYLLTVRENKEMYYISANETHQIKMAEKRSKHFMLTYPHR